MIRTSSPTWCGTPARGRCCSARTAPSTWGRAGRPRPPGEAQHGGALLADLLMEHGVRHVFGVPGGQTLALYDAILDREPALRHVLTRDERTAAYAADGYARVTGRAGVCDATVGPGAAKLPSGLGEALGASVPVVALVSDLPARLLPHRYRSAASQALDQAALLAAVTKWQAAVPDAATMPALVRQAFREATSGRRRRGAPRRPAPVRAGGRGSHALRGRAGTHRAGRTDLGRRGHDPVRQGGDRGGPPAERGRDRLDGHDRGGRRPGRSGCRAAGRSQGQQRRDVQLDIAP